MRKNGRCSKERMPGGEVANHPLSPRNHHHHRPHHHRHPPPSTTDEDDGLDKSKHAPSHLKAKKEDNSKSATVTGRIEKKVQKTKKTTSDYSREQAQLILAVAFKRHLADEKGKIKAGKTIQMCDAESPSATPPTNSEQS